jgi:hypothetical protein
MLVTDLSRSATIRLMIDPVLDQALIRQLCRVARDHGFRVERNDDGLPTLGGGICIYSERVIRISTRFSEREALPVLVHEVAHALLHSGKPWFDARESKGHDDEAKYVTSRVIRAVGLDHLLLEDVRSLPSDHHRPRRIRLPRRFSTTCRVE